jgi:hypothetical protein
MLGPRPLALRRPSLRIEELVALAFLIWAIIVARIAGVPFGLFSAGGKILYALGTGILYGGVGLLLALPWLIRRGRLARPETSPFSRANLVELGRCLATFAVCLLAYSHLKLLLPLANPYQQGTVAIFDPEFMALERFLGLGVTLNERMASLQAPWFVRLMDIAYVSFFFVFHAVFFAGFLRADRAVMRKAVGGWAVTFFLCVIGQYLLPAIGPLWAEPEWYAWWPDDLLNARGGDMIKASYDAVLAADPASYQVPAFMGVVAFPSMHVAHLVVGMLVARRHFHRLVFRIALPWAILISFSAAYWGYHYVVDLFAGALLGWIGLRVVEWDMRSRNP